MPSSTYAVFRDAILQAKRVACTYDGYPRELCPVILGYGGGEEKVLAYQVGGSGSRGLPAGGAWKCLFLSRVTGATLRDGLWREGKGHAREQTCVEQVDLDINIHVRRRRPDRAGDWDGRALDGSVVTNPGIRRTPSKVTS